MSGRFWNDVPAPLVIRGGRLVDSAQGLDEVTDLLVEEGRVGKLGQGLEAPEGAEVVEADGLVVTPGLIDLHVHLREPGFEYKETVATGTRAAAAGGFTAVACRADTEPVNDRRTVTAHLVAEGRRCGFARVHPVGAVSRGRAGEMLAEIGEMAAAGAVALSDGDRPVANAELLRRALLYARHFGLTVMQHAEDRDLAGDSVMHEGEWSTRLGLGGIPSAAEDVVVARDLILVEETGGRYHVGPVTTARSLELVRRAKARGLAVTCEVTPHHLILTDRAVADTGFSTLVKTRPPLRSEADRQALLEGLADGTVDAIASDHAPHHADEKDVEFSVAPFGMVGLETTLALCLENLVRPGVISWPRLVELLSAAPARILGLDTGSLEPGRPADLTLIDPDEAWTIDPAAFRGRARNSPFGGRTVHGRAVATFLEGRRVRL